VTTAIIEHLKLTLVPEEREGVFRRRTNNLAAHDLYLRGLRHLWNEAGQGFDDAIQCFERALAEDSNYAQAYWGLSDAYLQVAFWGNISPTEACQKVKQYARRALALDPALGEAHGALSYVHLIHDWNWDAAGIEALEAIRLTPNSSMVHAYYSWFLLNTGRVREGIAEALKAQSLDPVSSFIAFAVGLAFTVSGDLRRAIDEFQAGLRINPDFAILHEMFGRILFGNQRYEEARVAQDRAVTISHRFPYFVAGLAICHEQLGHKAEADVLWRELHERAAHEYVSPLCFLQMHALRGELPGLVRMLRQAARARDSRLCWLRVMPPEYYQAPSESRLIARLKRAVLRAAINRLIARRRIDDAQL
jgi:tetratricopeptide (TPR) repeat protein